MASKKSTNISLLVLGGVGIATLGYFIWIFLTPEPSTPPVERVISTDIQSGIVKSSEFKTLQEFANLPIVAGVVGRNDPFSPLDYNSGPVNTPTPSPVNSPGKQ